MRAGLVRRTFLTRDTRTAVRPMRSRAAADLRIARTVRQTSAIETHARRIANKPKLISKKIIRLIFVALIFIRNKNNMALNEPSSFAPRAARRSVGLGGVSTPLPSPLRLF